jgi:DNA-binding NarL/FixJ family response regulator
MLLADDDRGFRESLRGLFEPHFQLYEADSGEEAIEIVEQTQVDIFVFDMHMTELTGLETFRIVRPIVPVAPCVLITGDYSDELYRDAIEAEISSVLAKPVRKDDLVSAVATALHDAYDDAGPLGSGL